MVKLVELKIGAYRSTRPGTHLRFSEGFNVLLGTNGSGKTTLLNLIVMILRADLSPLENESFDLEWILRFEDGATVSCHAKQDVIKESVRNTIEIKKWSLCIEMHRHDELNWYESDSSGATKFNRSTVTNIVHIGPFEPSFVSSALLAIVTDEFELQRILFLRRMEAVTGRFDEGLGVYRLLMGNSRRPREFDPGEVTHTVEYTDGLGETRNSTFVGWVLMPWSIVEAVTGDRHRLVSEDPVFSSKKHSLLQEIAENIGAESLEIRSRFMHSSHNDRVERKNFKGFDIRIGLGHGVVVSSEELSFGQKRAMAFFYYVNSIKSIVIADEIVNGLHWQWIDSCVKSIGNKQAFLTSQNPILLDILPVESASDVQQTFIRCEETWVADRREWRWGSISEADAQEVWESYQLGIRQLGEVLRSLGLW